MKARLGILVLAAIVLLSVSGCGAGAGGDVSVSDVQKNAKQQAEAAKKDPGTGGNTN